MPIKSAPESHKRAILTVEDIRQWQERFVEISTEIGVAHRRIAELTIERKANEDKLKAAAMFEPKVTEWLSEQVPPTEEIALTEAIIKALRANAPRAFAREKLKTLLPTAGYPEAKLTANPNYLYVALKRLVDREQIEEVEGTFKIKG